MTRAVAPPRPSRRNEENWRKSRGTQQTDKRVAGMRAYPGRARHALTAFSLTQNRVETHNEKQEIKYRATY